jgi:signal transduction histidine kinase
MVDASGVDRDDGGVTRASPAERLMSFVCLAGAVVALGLTGRIRAPAGADQWTDGAAGARLWIFVGLVPVVLAGWITARIVSPRRGGLGVLAVATAVVVATVAGELLHLADPPGGRHLVSAIGAGLDVAAVAVACGLLATLLRPRAARSVVPLTALAGAATAVVTWLTIDATVLPRPLPAVSPLQVPSLSFLGEAGENLLLALSLGPLLAGGFLVWTLFGASIDERRRMRWLALSLVAAIGVVAVMQLVRLLGLIEMGDGFLVTLPRAVAWAAVAAGMAVTIIQPELGDAATAVRRVAVTVSAVSILGAAAGIAWFAADATTAAVIPVAPAAAAVLTVAGLFLPVRDRLERLADRWLFGEIGSDAELIDKFGAAAEHAGRSDVLELLVSTARRALRLRWARASTADASPIVASAGIERGQSLAPAARVALIDNDEQLGLLECGPKRGGPLNAHDRQLLGALGREAALRLRTVSQADELEARLRQIERQAVEVAASRARIVEAQDAERRRLERDIHDGVQQELASLIGKLRLALNQIDKAPQDASVTIAGAQDDVRRTLADVRAIAQGIHPAILDDHGIVRAIDARAKRLPLEVSVEAEPGLVDRRFDRAIEGAAYFVASEAMANIVKHAEATAVEVGLAIVDDHLVVRICDNGRGLGEDIVRGSGLTNMADRAAALGGRVTLEASATHGTIVVAELPLTPTVAV